MLNNLFKNIFGSKNDRELKRLWSKVSLINSFEHDLMKLSDNDLKQKTAYFKNLLYNKASLDDILPEVFAVVREASRRVLNMRHFDVQLIGGMVLHSGAVAEMRTGEGKTLTATLPLYLNGLTGLGAHLVTVNDYLANRDAEWMGKLYNWLNLSVGVICYGLSDNERRNAYKSDIVYATNNEIGFDYLRDNMKWTLDDCTQRGFEFSIIDEVDSILIDEARTPLVIAGPSEEDTLKYIKVDKIAKRLIRDVDFSVNEKDKQIVLTDNGVHRAEHLLGIENLYDPSVVEVLHGVSQSILAHNLYKKDVDYVIRVMGDSFGPEVVIVDEFTGRIMPGRRWSNGLHQAIEAKEDVVIHAENQTLATITFQNFFRMYKKLSGMTGTAATEANELLQIYNLEVIVIPTNSPMIRNDHIDSIYATKQGKIKAIVEEIKRLNTIGRPILVGTASIESSEELSMAINKEYIAHVVLNAKHHAKEAEIIAQAGRLGAVTIATNMAGRGTDILLGGNLQALFQLEAKKRNVVVHEDCKESMNYATLFADIVKIYEKEKAQVIALGGLHIIGTERNESRRIDNQLRGRAGRQGDPGSSHFYLSLEDDLMRIFGGDRIKQLMSSIGMIDNEPITANLVTKAIERSQKRVESHHFELRKHLLEYDNVMNKQRTFFYTVRREILSGNTINYIMRLIDEIIENLFSEYYNGLQTIDNLTNKIEQIFAVRCNIKNILFNYGNDSILFIKNLVKSIYREKEQIVFDDKYMRWYERITILQIIDSAWKRHLLVMDHLKDAIGLRGYSQKDPLVAYKCESYEYFEQMRFEYEDEIIGCLYRFNPNLLYSATH